MTRALQDLAFSEYFFLNRLLFRELSDSIIHWVVRMLGRLFQSNLLGVSIILLRSVKNYFRRLHLTDRLYVITSLIYEIGERPTTRALSSN